MEPATRSGRSADLTGGLGETQLSCLAALDRREAAASVAPVLEISTNAPCVLASTPPIAPSQRANSAKPSYPRPVASEPLLPIYLIIGSDRPKVALALRRLKARYGVESVDVLSAETATGDDAVAALNALGLFGGGGGRLVVVEGVEAWKKGDADAVAAYLAEPVAGAVLALVAGEPPKSSALPDLAAKRGRVLAYDAPKAADLPRWVQGQLERVGGNADADAARALVEIVGDDLSALASEAEKLATWAGERTITRLDVERIAVSAHEGPGWALTDAWGRRDIAGVLSACEAELERDVEPFLIAVRLAGQVALVRAAQTLAGEGLKAREIAKRVKRHEFRVRKALAHAENYSRDELDEAVVRLAELDAALKGATRLAGELELERALIDITRAREPAATR
jgi:DNA polymerase III delta subunit